jgi:hypothetical protein
LKHHLAGAEKDVLACTAVPIEVKAQMWDIVASLQQKLVKKTQTTEFEKHINVIAESADEAEKRKMSSEADGAANLFKRKNNQATINSIFKLMMHAWILLLSFTTMLFLSMQSRVKNL